MMFLALALTLPVGMQPPEGPPVPLVAGVNPLGYDALYEAALIDAKTLPPDVCRYTRYFDARNMAGDKAAYGVICYHVNSLSSTATRVKPRQVKPWLWAINTADYGWDPAVWEKLADFDPYFHVPAVIKQVPVDAEPAKPVSVPATVTNGVVQQPQPAGGPKPPPVVKIEDKDTKEGIAAPWLNAAMSGELATLTASKAPMIRADWFMFITGIQENVQSADRTGVGYYDWFGFKKLEDVENFVVLDRKGSIKVAQERGAIVTFSGVALNNRQVFRLNSIAGGWWETRDTKSSKKNQNASKFLLEDFKFDAKEIVATLYNGLPLYYLCDANGKQVDVVPQNIAIDQRASTNDRNIHPGKSCISCHVAGGLHDVRDYARVEYRGELSLATLALDDKKSRRTQAVYLDKDTAATFQKMYDRDAGDFAEAIASVTGGMKPEEFSKAYDAYWSKYLNEPVTIEKISVESGYSVQVIQAKLRAVSAAKKLTDADIANYLKEQPGVVRREVIEEIWPIIMLTMQGPLQGIAP